MHIVGSLEAAKDLRLFGSGNSDTVIADTYENLLQLTLLLHTHLDGASLGAIFDRVGQQIGDNLLDAHWVNEKGQVWGRGLEREVTELRRQLQTGYYSSRQCH